MFDSSNETPGRTDCNAKNINALPCTFAEKIKKKIYFNTGHCTEVPCFIVKQGAVQSSIMKYSAVQCFQLCVVLSNMVKYSAVQCIQLCVVLSKVKYKYTINCLEGSLSVWLTMLTVKFDG